MGVVDEERDLGVATTPVTVVAGHAHQLVTDQADEGHPVAVVDVGEAVEIALGETGPGREEPEVDALGGLTFMEPQDQLGVVGSDGTNRHRSAVGEDHVGLPPARIEPSRGILGHSPEDTGFPLLPRPRLGVLLR